MKKEKVLIFKNNPSVLVADGKYYATQSYRDEWLVGDEITQDSFEGLELLREIIL